MCCMHKKKGWDHIGLAALPSKGTPEGSGQTQKDFEQPITVSIGPLFTLKILAKIKAQHEDTGMAGSLLVKSVVELVGKELLLGLDILDMTRNLKRGSCRNVV